MRIWNPAAAWFDWLQAGAPAGAVERYPALDERGETSLPGVFVIGDLTGIPLLELAAASGRRFVAGLALDRDFQGRRRARPEGVLDLLVVGAGPAGVASALTAKEHGLTCEIVESAAPFATIASFPRGKPILVEPSARDAAGPLPIATGVKEGLLEDLRRAVERAALPITTGVRIDRLRREGDLVVATAADGGERRALVAALAIGKSGDARRLDVPGEALPHVANRLFDPAAHEGEDVLVVGGGDSAVEAAIGLARAGARVTQSYRGRDLTRPKARNLEDLHDLARAGVVALRLGTEVERIEADRAVLRGGDGPAEVAATAVYVLVGRQMPLAFLRNSGIRLHGEPSAASRLWLLLSLLFAGVIYFGKAMRADWLGLGWDGWAALDLKANLLGVAAWGSFALIPPTLSALAILGLRRSPWARASPWQRFKWAYLAAVFASFLGIFFGSRHLGADLGGRSPGFWYGLLYCTTMTVFGLRRVHVQPTPYVRAQTATIVAIQWVLLWLLPEIVIPWAGAAGHLGGADGFWRTQVFPGDSWWRAYGLVLAWPLFIWNVYTSEPTAFWLAASVVQTGVLIPLGVRWFGKGAYCGWICSCGGLAETLGDEHRTKAPHGPVAKRLENAGQVVLLAAFVMTGLKLAGVGGFADRLGDVYYVVVDIVFAGVLGVGVYFFLSGRIWCRFLCPLAALMHVYAKATRYRIFSRKARCISCNVCTKVCHMGIDVMAYAVRGRPMDDVQCVRCSACVASCPMDVLAFGRLRRDGSATPPVLRAAPLPPG